MTTDKLNELAERCEKARQEAEEAMSRLKPIDDLHHVDCPNNERDEKVYEEVKEAFARIKPKPRPFVSYFR